MDTPFEKVTTKDKVARYKVVIKQVTSIIANEEDLIANLANICAILKMNFSQYSWVGFYLIKKDDLVLGPFQGKPACIRIKKGKGICSEAIKDRRTIVASDVSKYPNHIYCDPDSKSEIVLPISTGGKIIGVLDIDSTELEAFDDIDRFYLEYLINSISPLLKV
jgi:L-methionine (R)-S-oxide reductase